MRLLALFILFFTTACTQQPAQIVYKGSEYFGRSNDGPPSVYDYATQQNTYSHRDEGFQPMATGHTQQYTQEESAPVGTVSSGGVQVRDLAPPPPARGPDAQPQSYSHQPWQRQSRSVAERRDNQPFQTVDKEQISRERAELNDVYERELAEFKSTSTSPKSSNEGFQWPVKGKVISGYGAKSSGLYNDGINIAAVEGDPIRSTADGMVVYASNELKGYGNMVIVRHENGFVSAYAHARQLYVHKGQRVQQGEVLGEVGDSGHVKESQLHFALRKGSGAVDPMEYLPRDVADVQ